jgi:hypothetical protein
VFMQCFDQRYIEESLFHVLHVFNDSVTFPVKRTVLKARLDEKNSIRWV